MKSSGRLSSRLHERAPEREAQASPPKSPYTLKPSGLVLGALPGVRQFYMIFLLLSSALSSCTAAYFFFSTARRGKAKPAKLEPYYAMTKIEL
jgi:hypothetical protein